MGEGQGGCLDSSQARELVPGLDHVAGGRVLGLGSAPGAPRGVVGAAGGSPHERVGWVGRVG